MSNIEIGIANKSDTDELINLFNKSIYKAMQDEGLEEHEVLKYTKEQVDYKLESLKEAFVGEEPKRVYVIALHDNTIVGSISYGPCSDIIKNHSNRDTENLNEIGSAYVLPEYQGKGIITILINYMVMILRSKGIKEICIDSGYDIAKQIWVKKFGKPDLILKDFWDDEADHFIWYKSPVDIKVINKVGY